MLPIRRTVQLATAALFLAVAACSGPAPVTASPEPPQSVFKPSSPAPASPEAVAEAQKTIAKVLDDWHDAAAKADEERYFAHLDEQSVFLGTDATERWDKAAFRAYAHPHFAKGKAWTFRSKRRDIAIAASGNTAWFDEDLETERLGPARGSGALVRTPDGWRIVQYNLSIPIPNERFDAVKKVIAAESPPPQ